MPQEATPLEPEEHVDGAGLSEVPGDPRFVMPRFGRSAAQSATGYVLETMQAVWKEAGRLPTLGTTIKFISKKSAGAYVVTILVSELFDTAVADMLDTVGNASFKAAVRALNDARRAETDERREYHRHTADGLLRLAYDSYQDAIGSLTFWNKLASPWGHVEFHGKAVQAATTVALIAGRADDRPAVIEWAGNARLHFAAYHSGAVEAEKIELPLPELTEGSLLRRHARRQYNQVRYFNNGLSGGRRIPMARARLEELKVEHERFEFIHEQLLKSVQR